MRHFANLNHDAISNQAPESESNTLENELLTELIKMEEHAARRERMPFYVEDPK